MLLKSNVNKVAKVRFGKYLLKSNVAKVRFGKEVAKVKQMIFRSYSRTLTLKWAGDWATLP